MNDIPIIPNKNGTSEEDPFSFKSVADLPIMSMDELVMRATNFNFLRMREHMLYTMNDENFIKDSMKDCLKKGIISSYAAEDPIWKELGIAVNDHTEEVKANDPHFSVYGSGIWKYDFKKVVLPDDLKLEMGCSCGRQLEPSSFSIIRTEEGNSTSEILKTLTYMKPGNVEAMKTVDLFDVVDEVLTIAENS